MLPYAPGAPWWHTMINAARPDWPDGTRMRKVRCTPTYVLNQSNTAPGHFIAIMHFDFWRGPLPRPAACLHTPQSNPGFTRESSGTQQDISDEAALDAVLTQYEKGFRGR